MCFSATASFTASAALTAAGIITTSSVKNRRELPLAAMPFIFAIQQFIEGMLWVNLSHGGNHALTYTYGFLFFALFWWPFYTPIMAFLLEKDKRIKEMIVLLWIIGLFVGIYQYVLFIQNPVAGQIVNHCIFYTVPWPMRLATAALYLSATVGVCLLSRQKIVRLFGALLGIFAAISAYLYVNNFTSVWCFSGAILSLVLCFYFRSNKKRI